MELKIDAAPMLLRALRCMLRALNGQDSIIRASTWPAPDPTLPEKLCVLKGATIQSTGDFFTAVQAEINKGADSAFSPAQSEGIRLLLTQRDELITLLARSDPAAAGRLGDLYNDYREVVR